jgi:hypothetical protein
MNGTRRLAAAGALLVAAVFVTPCAAMPTIKLSAASAPVAGEIRDRPRGCGPLYCWQVRPPTPGYRGGWWAGQGPAWEPYGPPWKWYGTEWWRYRGLYGRWYAFPL